MYDPFDTLLDTNFIAQAVIPTSVSGSQPDASQTHSMIPNQGGDVDWSAPPHGGGLVVASENSDSPMTSC